MNPEYTPRQALQAIKARIDGVWDDAQLMRLGWLKTTRLEDIGRILDCTPPDEDPTPPLSQPHHEP